MFSGKAAVIDLIREVDGFHVPDYRYEFPLIRIQDGIMDLEKALVDDWSPIRSNASLRRFEKLIRKMGKSGQSWISFSEEEMVGWNYDHLFQKRFFDLAQEYVSRLSMFEWNMVWPYYDLMESTEELIAKRLAGSRYLTGVRGAFFRVFLSMLERSFSLISWNRPLKLPRDLLRSFQSIIKKASDSEPGRVRYSLVDGTRFYEATIDFLEKLLSVPGEGQTAHTIVMHNAFEPFNPGRPIRYFRDAKCIVADRDPRDIYMTSISYSEGFNDQVDLYKQISGAHDIDVFIERFRMYRRNVRKDTDPPGRVLRLRFEDLIYNYDSTLNRIYEFLGESQATHIRKGEFFSPEVSRKNTRLWEGKNLPEIKRIESELGGYCFEY